MDRVQVLAFGTLLRRHRIAAGFSQEELAERAYISRRSISDIERGVAHRPRLDTVALLAEALLLPQDERDTFVEAARRLRAQLSSTDAVPGPTHTGMARPAAPSFVGRAQELALLERHLRGEGPPLVLLAGEPGIGKTRLLHAAAPRAVAAGLTMLEAGCQRRGGQEPYAPLLGALQRHVRSRSPAQLQAALRGCAWLVRLLPELAEGSIPPLPAWALAPEQERRLMGEAVVQFLGNVAGPAGTLLLLDDLQWASPDALALLATLTRSAAHVPLRIIGAFRDTEVQPQDPLSIMVADLAHAGLVTRRLLGPLPQHQAAQLLDELWAGWEGGESALREQMLQRTGGVPFFVVSCVQALQEDDREESPVESVPWDVSHSVRQRVAALPEAAREVVGVAAVVGRVVPRALLARVVTCTEEALLAALDDACQARLLEEQGQEAYQFAHDLIREVVDGDLGAARRAVLHRRVAEALEQQPGDVPVERLAYHYTQSGVGAKAALYLERAGDSARAAYANTTAVAYFREAVETLAQLGCHVDAARVREKWGIVLRALGHLDAAREVFEQAIASYEAAGDLEAVARALAETWLLYQESGTAREGLRRYTEVAEQLAPRGPSAALSALYAAMGVMFFHDEHWAEFLQMGDRAVELARGVEDPEIRAEAEVKRGHAMIYMVGHVAEGMRSIEEAIRLGEAAGGRMPNLGGWYGMLAGAHLRRGELTISRRLIAQGHEVAERQANLLRLVSNATARAEVAFAAGEWGQAEADYVWVRAMSRQLDLPFRLLAALVGLGGLAVARGDEQAAAQALDEAETLVTGPNHVFYERMVTSVLAERDILAGRHAAACARLVPLLARSDSQGRYLDDLPVWLAWARAELGDLDEARLLIERAIVAMRADDRRLALVDALRVQALVALKEGRWAAAERSVDEGLSLAREIGYPYGEARLLHLAGCLSAQKGTSRERRERLKAALAIFQRLGAAGDAAAVEQALG